MQIKNKKRLPTEEEFLSFKPKRLNFEWVENEQGTIQLKVPKFSSKLGKSFCKLIKKDDKFSANFDKIGSSIWKNCDGINTVKQILEIIRKEFPNEENIDQRLFLFLQQMNSLNYLEL